MKKIAVVGTSGSGKTYVANHLSEKLNIPHYEIDELYWFPGWVERDRNEFERMVSDLASGDQWIFCGNAKQRVWSEADTVIWLNYPFRTVLSQAFYRTISKIVHRTPICNGNYETFRLQFFSKNSIFLWVLGTYWKRKKKYTRLMKAPEYAHINFIVLRSRKECEKWLSSTDFPSR